jgi:hypothetical protein
MRFITNSVIVDGQGNLPMRPDGSLDVDLCRLRDAGGVFASHVEWRDEEQNKSVHGTYSRYREGCRCDECCEIGRLVNYTRAYRARKARAKQKEIIPDGYNARKDN